MMLTLTLTQPLRALLALALALAWAPAALPASPEPCDTASLVSEWEEKGLNLRDFKRVAGLYSELRLARPADASRFLQCLEQQRNPTGGKTNSALAETLMLFQEDLGRGPKEVRSAFLHYVINTKYPILVGTEDEGVLKDLQRAYAKSILIAPNWDDGGQTIASLEELHDFGRRANTLRYGRGDMMPIHRIPFVPSAAGYTNLNAVWMAEMSHLAYWVGERNPGAEDTESKGDLVKRQLRAWGYSGTELFEAPDTDTRAFLTEQEGRLVLAFKGTSSLQNFMTDADFLKESADWAPGQIHRGFAASLEEVWPAITSHLARRKAREKTIWVTGHSLGAALAQLAAFRLKVELKCDVRAVYTYGTPRVGDETFVHAYDRALGEQTFPHINHTDIVTRIPPSWVGFGYRPTANAQTREFTGVDHHTLRHRAQDPRDWARTGDVARMRRDALGAINGSTRYLTGLDGPLTGSTYAVPDATKESFVGTHGSYEYLFKLACVVMDQHFWLTEQARARE
jgi:hypothetical protein